MDKFKVSVPLSGLSSFNEYDEDWLVISINDVSVPLSGLSSFNESRSSGYENLNLVSVPLSGLSSFNEN